MKKTILICGLVAGVISVSQFIGAMLLGDSGVKDFDNGMVLGFSLMFLAFIFIFVGTKITRDKYLNGEISFGKAFRVGLYISLIASTVYVAVWLIDSYYFIPDFANQYATHELNKLKATGASEAAIAEKTKEMASFGEMYKNPIFRALITYTEILPVGLLVSLISALVLKRRRKQQIIAS